MQSAHDIGCKIFKSHGDGSFKLKEFKKVGCNVIFEKGVLVFHPENIELGSNIYVGHYSILKGYYKNLMLIGDDTWIGQGCFLHSAGGIKIGKAVGLGPAVKILTSVHTEEGRKRPITSSTLEFGEVVIGDGCDIGMGAIILPGKTIGEGSIVGAGSVVTKDVEPYSVVAGNPARLLKMRN
ncbi:MAG: acyltransferase [Candidatus Altiarchaeota archaeon]